MSYLTVERKGSVNASDEQKFISDFEQVTAGCYSPAMERSFCPDRFPTNDEKDSNHPDELTEDDKIAIDMDMPVQVETPIIVDKPTGDPEFDAALAAWRKRQPSWLLHSYYRQRR